MPEDKRFICLANSRKRKGFCIAGIVLFNGAPEGWIRPVSDRENEEVSQQEQEYEDGTLPSLLDIIDISLLDPKPHDFQRENWLLDPHYYWQKAGTFSRKELNKLCTTPERIWINGSGTQEGLNDKVPLWRAKDLDSSLMLIHVDELSIQVATYGQAYNNPRRRVQGSFTFSGVQYRMWVTDTLVEHTYLSKKDGLYFLRGCYLTISLCEPYKGACYKLIAAVIPDQGELS